MLNGLFQATGMCCGAVSLQLLEQSLAFFLREEYSSRPILLNSIKALFRLIRKMIYEQLFEPRKGARLKAGSAILGNERRQADSIRY